jgi:uncharacterized phage-like protein YoqJ
MYTALYKISFGIFYYSLSVIAFFGIMINIMKVVCFTGYRPFKLPFVKGDERYVNFLERAKNLIISQISEEKCLFISGMAQGADMMLASLVTELKKTYKNVYLECALPFWGQSEKYSPCQKAEYDSIIGGCDKITVICEKYCPESFRKRNIYMVDKSDIVIAVYDGKKGGTKFTCDYALKKGKRLIVINPNDNSIREQCGI